MNKLVKALSLLILPFTLVSCSSKLTNFDDKDKWGPLNEEQVVTFKKDCASLFGTDEDINGVIINEYFGIFDDMSFYFVSSSIHKDGIDMGSMFGKFGDYVWKFTRYGDYFVYSNEGTYRMFDAHNEGIVSDETLKKVNDSLLDMDPELKEYADFVSGLYHDN